MRLVPVFCLCLALALSLWPAEKKEKKSKKKDEEPPTQVLELPKEPPAVLTADVDRLSFLVTPASGRGLLSQQVKDALKWLLRESHGEPIVKLRAFLAGSADLRRVPLLVSETFGERRLPLPVVSVVQVGGLPLAGAQVVLEATQVEKHAVNPAGLAWIAPQIVREDRPLLPAAPLVKQSMERVNALLASGGAEPQDIVRITCFLSTLEDVNEVRSQLGGRVPASVLNLVQAERAPVRSYAACEAVARLRKAPAEPLSFLHAPGPNGFFGQAALLAPGRLAFTGTQLAFGFEPEDARLAYQRLGKTLTQAGASYQTVAVAGTYTLSGPTGELARKVGTEFYNASRPPAGALLPVEGLPSLDAAFGVEAAAVVPENK